MNGPSMPQPDFYGYRYKGEATVKVSINGFRRDLRLYTEVVNHSPSGFEWAYEGSGPAQLALAILCDCYGEEIALQHYQQFKRDIIAKLDHDEWAIEWKTISGWLEQQIEIHQKETSCH